MNDPWRGAQPLAEAVAPPIFPDHDTPVHSPVRSGYLYAYEGITDPPPPNVDGICVIKKNKWRGQETEIVWTDEQAKAYYSLAAKLWGRGHSKYLSYPVGTLIPCTIARKDILAVLQWHYNVVASGSHGWEFWVPRSGKHTSEVLTTQSRDPWFAGIHTAFYPGKEKMRWLIDNTNLSWTGFYLGPAPRLLRNTDPKTGKKIPNITWMAQYQDLKNMGWGMAPIYVGRQMGSDPDALTAKQGEEDGKDAADLASAAGFPRMSVVYLDIELPPPNQTLKQKMIDYYKAWVQGLSEKGYYPGVYCSPLFARDLMQADFRPVVWVATWQKAGGSFGSLFPKYEPRKSGSEAAIWQFASNATIRGLHGRPLGTFDVDSSEMPDPSVFLGG